MVNKAKRHSPDKMKNVSSTVFNERLGNLHNRAGCSWPSKNILHRYSEIVALIYSRNITQSENETRHIEARNS